MLASTLALCLAAALPTATRVAVLDLSTPGLDGEAGKALSQNLVGIIAADVERLGHDVISARDIEAMLSYEKKKDLVGCESDTACLAEIGGALGAELLVTGSIGKLGDDYNLALTLIDSRRADVLARFSGTAGSEGVLSATASRGVRVLFGKTADTAGSGTLLVKTDPEGGAVLVDGRAVGVAPVTVDDLAAGEHLVSATRGELSGKVTVRVPPGDILRVVVPLETAPPVRLKILSTPPEAAVWLDDLPVGQTPLVLDQVRPGAHRIRVRLEGYDARTLDVVLSSEEYEQRGEPLKIDVALERRVKLSPVPVGVAAGIASDVRTPDAGVAPTLEVFVAPWQWLELGVGFSYPTAVPLTARAVVRTSLVQAGALLRAVALPPARTGSWGLNALAGGLWIGVEREAPVGSVGLRLEAQLSVDREAVDRYEHPFTAPVALVAVWRS